MSARHRDVLVGDIAKIAARLAFDRSQIKVEYGHDAADLS
jgi:hypothetical protein